jgi:transcriptional regulator with XRE-family HTH domain
MGKKPKKIRGPAPAVPVVPSGGDPVFALNLRRLLDSKGLPAAELARGINVSPQAISQWLTLQTAPTTRRLVQIAAVLGVTVQRLTEPEMPGNLTQLRQVELGLASDRDGHPVLDEDSAKFGLWQFPRDVIEAGSTDVVVMAIKDKAAEPYLRVGDYVLADITSREITTSGVYLVLTAGSPAWKFCHPQLSDTVLVKDCVREDTVLAKDIKVLGRVLWRLTQP